MPTRNQPPNGIAEYTHTTGTGPYELRGALPEYAPCAPFLTDHKTVKYRITDGARQEVGFARYDAANNSLVRYRILLPPGGAPVNWRAGRKFIYVELTDDSVISVARLPAVAGGGGGGSPVPAASEWVLMPLVSGLLPGPDLVADGFGQCIGVPVQWTA